MKNKMYYRRLSYITLLILFFWGCGPKAPVSRPSEGAKESTVEIPGISTQEQLDFMATANRIRGHVASLIFLTENRADATFTSATDQILSEDELERLEEIKTQEGTTYKDLIFDLDTFIGYLPTDGQMFANISKGRKNVVAKFATYTLSFDAGIADQNVEPEEKSAIESNSRILVSELQFIEMSLPLPPDSLKTGSIFVVESDSVDMFFEIVEDVEEMTRELEELRTTVEQYRSAKEEMNAILEREQIMKGEIEATKNDVSNLYTKIDTTRAEQERGFGVLEDDLSSTADSMGTMIREVDAAIKDNIANLATDIADSISAQQSASDSLFFEVGTNMSLFRAQMDSLKGVVRYYDIAEKGLPKIDEDVLNILKLPLLKHKITLANGTIVVGHILAENMDVIVMQTTIGKLVIDKQFIVQYDEKFFPGPKVEFEGDYQLIEYSDREEFVGTVRNVGKTRADFVKVTFFLWDATTNPLGIGSGMVDGMTTRFATGVISDASLDPDQTGRYHVIVEKQVSKKVAYRTKEIEWREYEAEE